jgi:hypothetical protein
MITGGNAMSVASSPILNSKTIQNRVTMVIFSVAISPVFNEGDVSTSLSSCGRHDPMIPLQSAGI